MMRMRFAAVVIGAVLGGVGGVLFGSWLYGRVRDESLDCLLICFDAGHREVYLLGGGIGGVVGGVVLVLIAQHIVSRKTTDDESEDTVDGEA